MFLQCFCKKENNLKSVDFTSLQNSDSEWRFLGAGVWTASGDLSNKVANCDIVTINYITS